MRWRDYLVAEAAVLLEKGVCITVATNLHHAKLVPGPAVQLCGPNTIIPEKEREKKKKVSQLKQLDALRVFTEQMTGGHPGCGGRPSSPCRGKCHT